MRVILLSSVLGQCSFAYESLISLGIDSFLIGTREVKGTVLSRYCKGFHEIQDFEEDDAILNRIKTVCEDPDYKLIVPTCVPSFRFVSKNKRLIKSIVPFIPVSDLETFNRLNNKWDFYLMLREYGLPTPQTRLGTIDDHDASAWDLTYPVLVKPLESAGGIGLSLAENPSMLAQRLEERGALPLIVQEFIPGSDLGLNVLGYNGRLLAWTMQINSPAGLEFINNNTILEIGRTIVERTNFSGLANFDMRLDERDQSFKFLECNPRLWYSLNGSRYAGVNFLKLGIDAAFTGNTPFVRPPLGYVVLPRKKAAFLKTFLKVSRWKALYQYLRHQLIFLIRDPLFYMYTLYRLHLNRTGAT
jgi:predicted ATP-grasp superfamily ATP-dependent carboligase